MAPGWGLGLIYIMVIWSYIILSSFFFRVLVGCCFRGVVVVVVVAARALSRFLSSTALGLTSRLGYCPAVTVSVCPQVRVLPRCHCFGLPAGTTSVIFIVQAGK